MNCCSRKCSKIELTHSLILNIFPFVMLISLPPVEAPVMAPKIMSSIGMPIRGSRTEKHYFFIWRVLHVHWIQVTLAYFFIQAHIYVHCSIVHNQCLLSPKKYWFPWLWRLFATKSLQPVDVLLGHRSIAAEVLLLKDCPKSQFGTKSDWVPYDVGNLRVSGNWAAK